MPGYRAANIVFHLRLAIVTAVSVVQGVARELLAVREIHAAVRVRQSVRRRVARAARLDGVGVKVEMQIRGEKRRRSRRTAVGRRSPPQLPREPVVRTTRTRPTLPVRVSAERVPVSVVELRPRGPHRNRHRTL